MKRLLSFSWLLPILAQAQTTPTVIARIKMDGPGYFRLGFDGQVLYTKTLDLVIDAKGRLADKAGGYLMPALQVPRVEGRFSCTADGWVQFGEAKVGRIVMAVFEDANLLEKDGPYLSSLRRPKLVNPTPSGDGAVLVLVNYMNEAAALQGPKPKEVLDESTDRTKETPKKPITEPKRNYPKVVEGSSSNRNMGRGYPAIPLIALRPMSEVDHDTFTLADIADIAGEPELARKLSAVRVGNTPTFGVQRKLEASYIRTMLKAAGLDPTQFDLDVPAEVTVVRAGQVVAAERFTNLAIQEAELKFGKNGTLVVAGTVMDMRVPRGILQLRCTQCLEAAEGIVVTVDIIVGDRRLNSTTVRLRREGGVPKLAVGAQVRVIAAAGTMSVETTGRVTKVLKNGTEVEVKTAEGTLLVGRVLPDGSVEVL